MAFATFHVDPTDHCALCNFIIGNCVETGDLLFHTDMHVLCFDFLGLNNLDSLNGFYTFYRHNNLKFINATQKNEIL